MDELREMDDSRETCDEGVKSGTPCRVEIEAKEPDMMMWAKKKKKKERPAEKTILLLIKRVDRATSNATLI